MFYWNDGTKQCRKDPESTPHRNLSQTDPGDAPCLVLELLLELFYIIYEFTSLTPGEFDALTQNVTCSPNTRSSCSFNMSMFFLNSLLSH